MSRTPGPRAPVSALLAVTCAAGVGALAGCGESIELAYGDITSIVVGTDSVIWSEVEDSLYSALEPTIFTVRDERTFQVTHVVPGSDEWTNLAKFRQLLLVGSPSDPWMQAGLDKVRGDRLGEPPAVTQVYDVWARNQTVTLLVVPEGEPEAALSLLPELHRMYDRQFRQWARNRMFISGRDADFADTLATRYGFSLFLPVVYDWDSRDSIFTFRNDNPDPSELIRQITVTWRSPIPTPVEPLLSQDSLLSWRADVAADTYAVGQLVDTASLFAEGIRFQGHDAFQVQGIWQNPPEADWPAAGPFITRVVACRDQNRLYLVDSWLYAPAKEKYEYMLQLQTILDSFRCDGQPAREPPLEEG